MQTSLAQVCIFLALALPVLRKTATAGTTSGFHGDGVTCQISGDEKNSEKATLTNNDGRAHSCGDIDGKDKYMPSEVLIFRGEYSFPVDPITRRNCFDDNAMEFIEQGFPVVLENCTFHEPAGKWTIEYLEENLQDKDHTAYFSKNRKFLYYDEDKLTGAFKEWNPPTKKMFVYFKNFSKLMEELEEADNGSRAYFQSMLYLQDGVSANMLDDINSFNYTWLLHLVRRMGWGEDVANLLLVGMPDVVTPTHYDILENLYVQIFGRKRVILFSPEYFRSLYPYPVGHPHDRQTQVDFDKPDLNKFPRFSEIRGMEVALEPGEVLYIPNYWWHYIESESHSKTISMNFWFDPKNETETGNGEGDRMSNTTSEKMNNDKRGTEEVEIKGSGISEEMPETNTEDSERDINEQNKEEDNEKKSGNTEKENDTAEQGLQDEEDDGKEITLSVAQHLALLRDTETALFIATLSHKKVKQILEELLSRRFDYLEEY